MTGVQFDFGGVIAILPKNSPGNIITYLGVITVFKPDLQIYSLDNPMPLELVTISRHRKGRTVLGEVVFPMVALPSTANIDDRFLRYVKPLLSHGRPSQQTGYADYRDYG